MKRVPFWAGAAILAAVLTSASFAQAETTSLADSVQQFTLAPAPAADPPLYLYAGRNWDLHLSLAVGYKRLESKWNPARDQFQYGIVDVDYRPPNWPFSLAAQLIGTYSDDVPNINGVQGDFSNTGELNFGLRKVFQPGGDFEPFVSGGVSLVAASTSTDNSNNNNNHFEEEDSDTALGFWASVGFYWNLPKNWHIGMEGEYSYGKVHLFGDKLNAGGISVMLLVGYHW